MCWTCKLEDLKPLKADKDIEVYKIVKHANEEFCVALYKKYCYEVEGWNINSSRELLIFLEDYYHKKWGNTYNLPPGYELQYQDYLKQIPLC